MKQLDSSTARLVAASIIEELVSRPDPVATYQFVIPGGALLTVSSSEHTGRRMLVFYSHRGMPHLARQVVGLVNWPKKHAQTGAWFTWPMSDRERRRHIKTVEYCLQSVRYNDDVEAVEGAIVVEAVA